MPKLSVVTTGIPSLDKVLEGGYTSGKQYLIYGEEKSGKTSLALQAAVNGALSAPKLIWIEGASDLHPSRLRVLDNLYGGIGERIQVFSPRSHAEQVALVARLGFYLSRNPGMVVLDDFTYLYRVEASGRLEVDQPLFKDISFQLAFLKRIALEKKVPILVISLSHDIMFGMHFSETRPVADRISTYWADVVLRTNRISNTDARMITVEKGAKVGSEAILFRVADSGIEPVQSPISIE